MTFGVVCWLTTVGWLVKKTTPTKETMETIVAIIKTSYYATMGVALTLAGALVILYAAIIINHC